MSVISMAVPEAEGLPPCGRADCLKRALILWPPALPPSHHFHRVFSPTLVGRTAAFCPSGYWDFCMNTLHLLAPPAALALSALTTYDLK